MGPGYRRGAGEVEFWFLVLVFTFHPGEFSKMVNENGILGSVVVIFPYMAEKWLLENNFGNRNLAMSRVREYAAEIKAGRWRLTHQGIAFDHLGNLADGQHRLAAIVEAGQPVEMMVFRGILRNHMDSIDTGKTRAAADTFTFLGEKASFQTVAIARLIGVGYCMARGMPAGKRISNGPLLVLHHACRDAMQFAMPEHRSVGLRNSCLAAAIASAWFCEDRERLASLKTQLGSGVFSGPEDSAGLRLRDLFLSGNVSRCGTVERVAVYVRACTAIRWYLDRRPMLKVHGNAECVFRIPDIAGFPG